MTAATDGRHAVWLIGPYPPPYGGVSVHIARLHRRLAEKCVAVEVHTPAVASGEAVPDGLRPWKPGVWPVRWFRSWQHRWWISNLWRCRGVLVHCHDGWQWTPTLAVMSALGCPVVMTFHDDRTSAKWTAAGLLSQRSARWLAGRKGVVWVAVSESVRAQLRSVGVPGDRIHVIPAFLPAGEPMGSDAILPPAVQEFVNARRPCLVTYGWCADVDAAGVDVYGFDLCFEVLVRLKRSRPSSGLICLVPGPSDPGRLSALARLAAELGVTEDVLFQTTPLTNGTVLWRQADVFLRASNTDGDSIAVREALEAAVPVVASDAARRPDGVFLFQSRDVDEMFLAVQRALEHGTKRGPETGSSSMADFFSPVLEVYEIARKGA